MIPGWCRYCVGDRSCEVVRDRGKVVGGRYKVGVGRGGNLRVRARDT